MYFRRLLNFLYPFSMNTRLLFTLVLLLMVTTYCKIPVYTTSGEEENIIVPPVPDIYDDSMIADVSSSDVVNYRLPDGYLLKIRVKDNSPDNMAETSDGFSIVMNPEGFYEFTIKDDHGLPQPTGIIARNPEDRTSEEWRILNSIP